MTGFYWVNISNWMVMKNVDLSLSLFSNSNLIKKNSYSFLPKYLCQFHIRSKVTECEQTFSQQKFSS